MPNWCNNYVKITGPKQKLKDLSKAASDENLLNFMYHRPEELNIVSGRVGSDDSPEQKELEKNQQANLENFGHKDWYDWSVANWGTKWEISEFYTNNIEGDTLVLGFDTAWSPPCGAFEHYIANNEDVSINAYYFEPGMDFMGNWYDGSDECLNISDITDKELETDLSYYDDYFGILESRYQYRDDMLEAGDYDEAKQWLTNQGSMTEDEADDYVNEYIIEHGLQKQEEESHA
jgi:hypothetical protein